MLLLAVLGTCLVCAGRTHRGAQVEFEPAQEYCAHGKHADRDYAYCIYGSVPSTPAPIVYHFHGRGLSEKHWNDATLYTGLLQAHWQARGFPPPTVVSVSLGPEWLMMPRTPNPRSGALEVFLTHIMPAVEKRTGPPQRRIALGASMGALNALLLGLHAPSVFDAVAALNPPLHDLGDVPDAHEAWRLWRRQDVGLWGALTLFVAARRYVEHEADVSALSLLRRLPRLQATEAPRFYLSAGLHDAYGSFTNTHALAQAIKQAGMDVTWRPLAGGHTAVDISSLAAWLAP